jgi:hypothetical protein
LGILAIINDTLDFVVIVQFDVAVGVGAIDGIQLSSPGMTGSFISCDDPGFVVGSSEIDILF